MAFSPKQPEAFGFVMENVASERGTKVLTRLQGKLVKVRTLSLLYLCSVCPSVPPFEGPLSTTRAQVNSFTHNLILGSFAIICRRIEILTQMKKV